MAPLVHVFPICVPDISFKKSFSRNMKKANWRWIQQKKNIDDELKLIRLWKIVASFRACFSLRTDGQKCNRQKERRADKNDGIGEEEKLGRSNFIMRLFGSGWSEESQDCQFPYLGFTARKQQNINQQLFLLSLPKTTKQINRSLSRTRSWFGQ